MTSSSYFLRLISLSTIVALPYMTSSFAFYNANLLSCKGPTRTDFATFQLAASTKNGEGNILQSTFTGGAFEKKEDYEQDAMKLASKLKSVKDLGWKGPPRRKGSTRPKHRAWGGSSELPVQLKANYDESNPNCVEAWLTQSDFEKCVGVKESTSASDTVFVALAKGAAFAERDVCEDTIASWYPGGSRSIVPEAFWASVEKGRSDLAFGWSTFIGFNTLAASCIVFPTNPLAKGLERVVEAVLKTQ